MVTVVPLIEQGPVAVMLAAMPELEVAERVKLDWYVAVVGAPVKVTTGAALVAVAVCLIVGAAR